MLFLLFDQVLSCLWHDCCFSVSTSLFLFLSFHLFWLSFLLFLFAFSSYSSISSEPSLSPPFPSLIFNLLCSLPEPLLCPSTSSAQHIQIKTISLARIVATDWHDFEYKLHCGIEKWSKIREKKQEVAEVRRVCRYHIAQWSIALQSWQLRSLYSWVAACAKGGCPKLCFFSLLNMISVWSHPGET